ncbi:hypothetical protein [Hymenobacter crusticola]|uniref:Uncharacterized protein n=1 Tax=Hymenobacter crusticola TaxID=1770526 RepID=A0A243W6E3_9BACT|nr:hypothetical protein [Hymenobacter crusticola]OUJ69794.1 hypothetical protein BXP70_26150 [Hymenobacter crusticola]
MNNAIASAKKILDNNTDAKDAFIAFSGLDEKDQKEWNNPWTENGKVPIIQTKTHKDGTVGMTSNSATGRFTVGMDPRLTPAEMVVSVLHEYVHGGDNTFRVGETIDGSDKNSVPGDRWGGITYQLNAFIKAAATDPAGYLQRYPAYHENGKPVMIEIEYGFEQAAFGNPIATKQDYENFSEKYLKEVSK